MNAPDVGEIIKAASEPLIKLIDAISAGTGAVFEPTRIVRKAEADAKAKMIHAKAELAEESLRRRAAIRLESQNIRRQQNIEQIGTLATHMLPDTVSTKPVDRDWSSRFFNYAQDVSDDEMQKLWAAILAGEVSSPGQFSLRTLSVVSEMLRFDAELFTKLQSRCVEFGVLPYACVFADEYRSQDQDRFTYAELVHLEDMGVIVRDDEGLVLSLDDVNSKLIAKYFDHRANIQVPRDSELELGVVALTQAGRELTRLGGGSPNQEFWSKLCDRWMGRGLTVERS